MAEDAACGGRGAATHRRHPRTARSGARTPRRGARGDHLRPYFLLGTITLLLGALHGPYANLLRRRRALHVDSEGVHGKLSRFRTINVRWADVHDVRLDARQVIIETSSHSVTIPLRRYRNAGAIRDALLGWRERLAATRPPVTPIEDA